jgi:heptaprenyl diphosphate synthase
MMIGLSLLEDIQKDLQLMEQELDNHVHTTSPLLTRASLHLFKAGGKRLRPAFALLAGKCCGSSTKNLLPLATALELIHMATLVHDDVIDNSLTRRGKPTVKAKWGDQISLHTGDYLFAKSLVLLARYNNARMAQILADISVEMCQGEIQQIATAYDLKQTVRDYFYRIKRKTALLIAASCQLGAVASNAPPSLEKALTQYGYNLGMAFQITDDILDMIAEEEELGKPVGGDLQQGIITLPTIYALQHSKEKERLAQLIINKEKTPEDLAQAIDIIKESGGISYSFAVASAFIEKAKKQLEAIPEEKYRRSLARIADFIQIRKY